MMPSYPSYTPGLNTRSERSRRTAGSSRSSNSLRRAFKARRTISTLAELIYEVSQGPALRVHSPACPGRTSTYASASRSCEYRVDAAHSGRAGRVALRIEAEVGERPVAVRVEGTPRYLAGGPVGQEV